jgi:hypothetical protein
MGNENYLAEILIIMRRWQKLRFGPDLGSRYITHTV